MTKTLALSPMAKANLIQDAEYAASAVKDLLIALNTAATTLDKVHEVPMSNAKAMCTALDRAIAALNHAKNFDFVDAIQAAQRVSNHTTSVLELTQRRGLRVGKPCLVAYRQDLAKQLAVLEGFLQFAQGIAVKGTADALSATVESLAADAKKVDAAIAKLIEVNAKNPVFMTEMNIVPPFNYFYVHPRKFALHKLTFDRIGKGDNSDYIVLKNQKVLVVDNEAAEAYNMRPLEMASTVISATNTKRPKESSELSLVMEEHASLKGSSQYTFYWVVPLPTLHLLQPIIGQGTLSWGLAL